MDNGSPPVRGRETVGQSMELDNVNNTLRETYNIKQTDEYEITPITSDSSGLYNTKEDSDTIVLAAKGMSFEEEELVNERNRKLGIHSLDGPSNLKSKGKGPDSCN
jgi:hypothetical protein